MHITFKLIENVTVKNAFKDERKQYLLNHRLGQSWREEGGGNALVAWRWENESLLRLRETKRAKKMRGCAAVTKTENPNF